MNQIIAESPAATGPDQRRPYAAPVFQLIVLGVILPVVAVCIEVIGHVCCSGSNFDPVPSWWHIAYIGLVPLSITLIIIGLRKHDFLSYGKLKWLSGLTIGVGLIYSLTFIPIVPLLLLGLLIGIITCLVPYLLILDLAGWSPFFAVFSGIQASRTLDRIYPESKRSGGMALRMGILSAVVLIFVIDMPSSMTRMGMQMAVSADSQKSASGIRFLRSFGNRDVMLKMAYSSQFSPTDIIGWASSSRTPVDAESARSIFYKVTGLPFNDASLPKYEGTSRFDPRDVFNTDQNRAAENVGGKARGVALTESELIGDIDPNAAISFLDWRMKFHNNVDWQQEARMQVTLPPDAVVSDLKLLIDGKWHDAVFASRAQTRAAYTAVVQERRDPVLVTTYGPDKVLVQCFPVPPKGDIEIRFGITAPLKVSADLSKASLTLPRLTERNYEFGGNQHVYLYANGRMIRSEKLDLQTQTADDITVGRNSTVTEVWCRDRLNPKSRIITQTISNGMTKNLPRRAILVLDCSGAMQNQVAAVSSAIARLPDIPVALIKADDNNSLNYKFESKATVAKEVQSVTCLGGQDNIAALREAIDVVGTSKLPTAIVWVHGPQPSSAAAADELSTALRAISGRGMLYDFEAVPGANIITEHIDSSVPYRHFACIGYVNRPLIDLFGQWNNSTPDVVLTRHAAPIQLASGSQASTHLADLWARDEVTRELSKMNQTDKALKTAVNYRVVTPISGAVVLQTDQDYVNAGLDPNHATDQVPTVPEPEFWLLLIVVAGIGMFELRRRKLSMVTG
jgi:hypothetical protein